MIHRFNGKAIPELIVSGPGSRLGIVAELDRRDALKIVIVCGQRLRSGTPFVGELEAALGSRVAAVIDRVEANTPVASVHRVVEHVAPLHPDAILSLGGGAVHDMAKAIALMVPSGRSIVDFVSRFEPPSTFHAMDVDVDPLPVLTVPSTFSAADVVGGGAVTDTAQGEKLIFVHPKLTPAAVFLDAEVVATTPAAILAASGMNAIHHCLEACYSKGAQPITDALAIAALRGLLTNLPFYSPSASTPTLAVHQAALNAASMSGLTYANSWLGIGHSVCHSLGGRYGLSHGLANAVMVIHSARFNFDAARARLAYVARSVGVTNSTDEHAAARDLLSAIESMADKLEMPRSLSAIDLPPGQFGQIAQDVMRDPQTYWNPRATDVGEVEAWLESIG
nr:iron-containing alcohol dehydrogenase [Mesorhizobium sp.]